jgi:two-component system OmpR family response regulator
MPHALVVEDDATTSAQISDELVARGFLVTTAADGLHGVALAESERFDVITLDRMLPGLDGLSVVERLRAQGIDTPVLMISALSDVDERIAGLRAGGDDYLVKPFAPAEMAARVEVLLRRAGTGETVLQVGAIRIDLVRHEVSLAGTPVRLLQMEYKLLEFLARNAEETISRQIIFEKVWGYFFDPGANLINVHVARLRKKLDRPGFPSPIVTVKGEGYRLDAV